MVTSDFIAIITTGCVIVAGIWNARAIHRVHVQFNSRFDQLIEAAEVRGAAIERAAADMRAIHNKNGDRAT